MATKACSSDSTMKPVTPGSTTSGTEPQFHAITGVPQAIDSIMTKPKGSGQQIGNSSALALPRNSDLSASPISPTNSTRGSSSSGLTTDSKYAASALSTFAAILSGMPAWCAIRIATSARFSGEIRPRKAR